MNLNKLSEIIKKYRKENNLTQQQLADQLEISRSTLSSYENITAEPSLRFMHNFSQLLGCSIDELINSAEIFKNYNFIETPHSFIPLKKRTIENKKQDLDESEEILKESKNIAKKLKKTYDDFNFSKHRLDVTFDELALSKRRLDRLYEESLTLVNREERLNKIIKNLEKLTFNLDINKNDTEIADEITPSIEDLRNEKLISFEEEYKKKNYDNFTFIKQYGNVAAGLPIFACEEVERLLYLPQKYLRSSDDYFALTIKGDSMNNIYEDGEVIIVKKTGLANNGDIIIASILGEATCKEYYYDNFEKKHKLIPHSTNPKHKPQLYSDDEIMILGVVENRLNDILDKEIDED
ncbi:helix-turn-helix domain-containing protein [Clostridium perfringens]|uniref:helix-turn-helix domain-containing protein n=1 Tax=Clostridium perfringens TaxID=1502 RepID=UPI000D70EE0D|nr:XRE family transcriptional regulator [Clostridium perfringens]MBO3424418.1 helix-turn-helix domain-containing protein [Clostridium perfringens]PWX10402.1 LexA family transcriptional regulator [Clostridium perfringens]PWX37272.1 LexA family transcriptional regulator [Clostridium perfringens]PWX59085.1 LexA family transcriptional regulator [Clostridium perfringens]